MNYDLIIVGSGPAGIFTALELIKKVVSQQKNLVRGPKNIAEAIPQEFLEADSEMLDAVNLQEVYNAFAASATCSGLS